MRRSFPTATAARVALVGIALVWPSLVLGQTAPLSSHVASVRVDSGLVENSGSEPAIIFSTTITVPEARWLRLRFDEARLAGDEAAGTASVLLVTSLADGKFQRLHARHVQEWRRTSAYFNGNAVFVELLAYPSTGGNRVRISQVIAGELQGAADRSICGPLDDRVLSTDPRAGRLVPGGCTGYLIDDCMHCLLTAGHCTDSNDVLEFNVPLSESDGSLNHPGPEDQYAVDPGSVQSNGGQGQGDDWGYFGCFPNSTTGLTPYEAQGASYIRVMPPPVSGNNIRITGYGTVSNPVPRTWNQVEKTHVGPFATSNGSLVQYRTDTTGGNSGSPVIWEETGQVIGIHTHGGCTSGGGQNSGTGLNHSGLQNALAGPVGVCACVNPPHPGDLNCDSLVDFEDINPFVLALNDQAQYQAAYPDCRYLNADCNNDGIVDFDDIAPFVDLLAG